MYDNDLYCPRCRFQVIEDYPIVGVEVFCQNCLVWSFICIDKDSDDFYLEFSREESTKGNQK